MENPSKKESETDKSAPRRRRKAGLRFAPKAIAKNAPVIIPKVELNEESKVAAIDKQLQLKLRTPKSTDALGSRPKAEKKETPVQVAFGVADPSVLRTFSARRNSSSDVPAAKLPKKHDDPWDYTSTNYPVTLPMLQRRPYSRDPDLDEDEFGQSSSKAHDGELTAAEELGLMVRMDEPQLLFFQLPRSLPLQRQPDQVDEADTDTNVDVNAKSEGDNRKKRHYPIHGCKLRELPGGLMGKILVYRSGKVKMKLSDAHFDVSAGSNCSFAQEAVAIDTREKHCSSLGEVGKCAIVTPDIDYLLGCIKME
ncbi:hypothetical protein QOZ80_2AG0132050 [Eleusine coracana subsp. coracana]|nr:hypothetical protein QOZ80_2AG0132050 [Eleusine coracana subsp. coracana]